MSKELENRVYELRKLANDIEIYLKEDKIREDFIKRLNENRNYRELVKKRKSQILCKITKKLTIEELSSINKKYKEAINQSLNINWNHPHKLHATVVIIYRKNLFGIKIPVYKYYRFMLELLIPGIFSKNYLPATTNINDEWIYKLAVIKEKI